MTKPLVTVDTRMIRSSGIGTYIQNILSRLIELRTDWRFALIGTTNELSTFGGNCNAEIEIIESDARIYSVVEQLKLPRLIPENTSLFWSPHFNIPIFYPGKLVVTVHDCFHLAMPHYLQSQTARLYAKALFGYVRSSAIKVLVDSEFTQSELVRLAHIESSRIELVYCGASKRPSMESNKSASPERPYLLYVGNIKPHKNIRLLLEAFQDIQEKIPHDLLIVGKKDGFLTGEPELLALAEKISERIRFTGIVSDSELHELYQNAECLVMPSKYEGFGLPPIEAMTYGCPVISSTAASLPEVCGSATLYFDPDDRCTLVSHILTLTSDNAIRDRLIQNGYENIKRFSWDRSAEKVARLFDTLIA